MSVLAISYGASSLLAFAMGIMHLEKKYPGDTFANICWAGFCAFFSIITIVALAALELAEAERTDK